MNDGIKTIGQAFAGTFESLVANRGRDTRSWPEANERASIAKSDEMSDLPAAEYGRIVREIDDVLPLCESPIEQVALYQMAGRNFASSFGPPVYCHVMREIPAHWPMGVELIIVPQVEVGPYRVDFMVVFPSGRRFAVECDGEEFHDEARDAERDRNLLDFFGIQTIRATGSQIWRNRWSGLMAAMAFSMGGFR
ncbi:hypothetical protein ACI2KT_19050 [Ensifer adhaerens]|uniref:hypothetical protein n=1 Tax=Ensifer adhaerens TaxID=106592 RepID=UPI00384F4723